MIVNGKITKPANGSLSVSEVAQFLNVGKRSDNRYHLADVCVASAINIWARIKPVRSIRECNMRQSFDSTLTNYDANNDDFQAADFGFDLSNIAKYSPVQCLNLAKNNNGAWPYLKPQGTVQGQPISWFRLLDFNGYNSRAVAPYSLSYEHQTSAVGDKSITVYEDSVAEIKMQDIASESFEGLDPENAHLFLICRKRGYDIQRPIPRSEYTLKYIFENYSRYTFNNIHMPTNGIYEFVVAASEYDPEDPDDVDWLYFPGTYGEVEVDDTQFALLMSYDDDKNPYFNAYVVYDDLFIVDYLYIMNDIPNNLGAYNISITTQLTYLDDGSHEILYTKTDSISDMGGGDEREYNNNMSNIDISGAGVGQNPLEDIYIRTTYTYREGSASGPQRIRYMDYLSGSSKSCASVSDAPRVTLQSILNA